jgi:hypothetical protein
MYMCDSVEFTCVIRDNDPRIAAAFLLGYAYTGGFSSIKNSG